MLSYYMPTKVLWGKDVIKDNGAIFNELGKKALIVTGKKSSRINGALNDVINVLELGKLQYEIYDEIPENPSIEVIEKTNSFESIDFVIGIGGGSPIDAAKAVALFLKNKNFEIRELFWGEAKRKSLPVIAVPTTAGTGTEVTQYSIMTDNQNKTKRSIAQVIFPAYAFIDTKYFMTMPKEVRINTSVDTLSHLIESYLSAGSNILNVHLVREGLMLWGKCKVQLSSDNQDASTMGNLIKASLMGGMAISQTSTSLVHGMGYPLTYFENMQHGKANGILLKAYMEMCKDTKKVDDILELLNFKDLESFGNYINEILGIHRISRQRLLEYSKSMISNIQKLKNHPDQVLEEDIIQIYTKSLLVD